MLDSLLARNPWFDGEIVVIHHGLDETEQTRLAAAFPRLRTMSPPKPLTVALDALAEMHPHLAGRIARFHSLATFWIEGNQDILFCDSDLLFTGDMSAIFAEEGDLLAAPDRAMLQGNRRDPVTLQELDGAGGPASHRSFNAGLMVLRPALRCEANRARILEQLDGAFWTDLRSNHTDQALLYRMFGEIVTLLDQRYNRMVGHAESLRGMADLPIEKACVLHFNGPAKPWRLERHSDKALEDAHFIKALELWFDAHCKFLVRQHFSSWFLPAADNKKPPV